MNKSDKIREYFRKHPDANVTYVATKFQAPKPMTYKLRKQVQDAWQSAPATHGAKKLPRGFSFKKIRRRHFTGDQTDIDETSGPRTTASLRTALR
jgi:hypothetical protein